MPNPACLSLFVQLDFHERGESTKTRATFTDCGLLMEDAKCVSTDDRGAFADSVEVKAHDPRLVQIASPRTLAADEGLEPSENGVKARPLNHSGNRLCVGEVGLEPTTKAVSRKYAFQVRSSAAELFSHVRGMIRHIPQSPKQRKETEWKFPIRKCSAYTTTRRAWSERRESNPHVQLGGLTFCH